MSLDTLQKIYNITQSGSLDPLFLLTPKLLSDPKLLTLELIIMMV